MRNNSGGYRCISPEDSASYKPGQNQVDSKNTWQVVGSSDQSAVKYTYTNHYASGTVVTDGNGNYYMFTPPYNDTRNYSNYPLTNTSAWTQIAEDSPAQKPPMIESVSADVKNYSSGTTYSQGDYCVVNGVLYQRTGSDSSKTGIDYSSVNNGTWTQVSSEFVYQNASYKTGDKVWYKGQYYTATKDFTTYSGFGVPSNKSDYWKPAE